MFGEKKVKENTMKSIIVGKGTMVIAVPDKLVEDATSILVYNKGSVYVIEIDNNVVALLNGSYGPTIVNEKIEIPSAYKHWWCRDHLQVVKKSNTPRVCITPFGQD